MFKLCWNDEGRVHVLRKIVIYNEYTLDLGLRLSCSLFYVSVFVFYNGIWYRRQSIDISCVFALYIYYVIVLNIDEWKGNIRNVLKWSHMMYFF